MSDEQEEIDIRIDWTSEPAPVYANGAQVVHTQREFALVFTDFVGFESRGAPEGEQAPRARVVASIRLTPDVFFQLAAACGSNWNKFVNRFSGPDADTPRFTVVGGDIQLEGVPGDEG